MTEKCSRCGHSKVIGPDRVVYCPSCILLESTGDLFGDAPKQKEGYDFYNGTPPHQKHSPTSQAAAIKAEPTAGTKRWMVLAYIRESGGATDEQIQDGLGMNANTQRPRRRELEMQSKICDSGRTMKTHSGRDAVVWESIEFKRME